MRFTSLLFIFLGFFIFIYFYNLGSIGLFDVDETRHAEIGREMLELRDWVVPYTNYKPDFNKPIFFYWMEVFFMNFLGVNELSARLPSTLTSLFCTGFLFFVVLQFFSLQAALISGLVLMTSFEFIALSRASILDMSFTSFLCLSLMSFYLAYEDIKNEKRNLGKWFFLGFIFLSCATLTKGPAAVILLGAVFFIFFLIKKEVFVFFKNKSFWLGSVLFFLLTLPWYILVHIQTQGEFTKSFFGHHNFSRYLSVVSGHNGPIYFYFIVILIGFLPWIFFLPQSILYLSKTHNQSSKIRKRFLIFLFTWASVVFLFFTFSRTKLLTYILPIYPALSAMVGIWLSETIETGLNKKFIKQVFISILSFLLIGYFITLTFILPAIDLNNFSKGRNFAKSIPSEARLLTFHATKSSLRFYSRRKTERVKSVNEILDIASSGKEKIAIVIDKTYFSQKELGNLHFHGEDKNHLFFTNY